VEEAPLSPIVNSNFLAMQSFGGSNFAWSPPPPVRVSASFPTECSSSPLSPPPLAPASSEEYMDEAVEELFLDGCGTNPAVVGDIMDFVDVWDPAFEHAEVNDDIQLGNLLDKLLED
jgi:hypothetical protein